MHKKIKQFGISVVVIYNQVFIDMEISGVLEISNSFTQEIVLIYLRNTGARFFGDNSGYF